MTLYIETIIPVRPQLPGTVPPITQVAQATITPTKPESDKPVRSIEFTGAMTPMEFQKRMTAALGMAAADPKCIVELTLT